MTLNDILHDGSCVGPILRAVLNPGGYLNFRDIRRPVALGLYGDRPRHAFRLMIEALESGHILPEAGDDRQLQYDAANPPETLSPITVAIEGLYPVSFKLKDRLGHVLQSISAAVPKLVTLEVFLDSVAHALHMADRSTKMSYRDHLVHPVAVCALGIHMLLEDRRSGPTSLEYVRKYLWDQPAGRRLLGACTPGGIDALEASLELRTTDEASTVARQSGFALLAWILAACYHDIGRHILTLAQLQASNVAVVTGRANRPAFSSYVARSCFSAQGDLKACECHYPREVHKNAFYAFVRQTSTADIHDLVQNRLDRVLPEIVNEMKAINPDSSGPKILDHAFLSSLELFIWSWSIEQGLGVGTASDAKGQVMLASALRLASVAVLPHHFGAEPQGNNLPDTASKLNDVTFLSNPLGVLLRVVDFFQSFGRPFLKPTAMHGPRGSDFNSWDLPYSREYSLNDIVNVACLETLSGCDKPFPFKLTIDSRLPQALDSSMDMQFPTPDVNERNRIKGERVGVLNHETEVLGVWLASIDAGMRLAVNVPVAGHAPVGAL